MSDANPPKPPPWCAREGRPPPPVVWYEGAWWHWIARDGAYEPCRYPDSHR